MEGTGPRRGIWVLLLPLVLSALHSARESAMSECETNPEMKCNFICDCSNCTDEQMCGYSGDTFVCDFEESTVCGWKNLLDSANATAYRWERRQRGPSLPDSGPSSDFTTGTSAGWFVAVTSVDSQSSSTAVLASPTMRQSAPTCRIRLRYFIWDAGDKGLDNAVLWVSVEEERGRSAVVWSPEGGSVRSWREATVFLGRISRPFRVQLHSQRSQGLPGDVAVDQLEFLDCALPVPEKTCGEGSMTCARKGCVEARQVCDWTDDCGDSSDENDCGGYWGCNFENDLCGWDLRTLSSLKFHRTSQQNISVNGNPKAGPGRDHTTNSAAGHFLYLTKLSDDVWKNDWSSFQSPVLEPTNSTHPCRMTLYTHQFGPRSGGLSVLVVFPRGMTATWERGGELGDLWVKAEVEFVVNSTFQILFVGAIRDREFGGVAIDDIVMSPGCRIANASSPSAGHPEPPVHPCTDSNKLCDFQVDCTNDEDEDQCGDFSFQKGSKGWTDTSLGVQSWALHWRNDTSKEEYLYVTEAPGQQLTEAKARSPPLGPSGPACTLRFAYSLTGSRPDIGEVSVTLIDKVLGTQSRLWEFGGKTEGTPSERVIEVYIGARDHRFQLEFGGFIRQLSNDSKITVKDVRYLGCHPQYLPSTFSGLSCNFETDLCGWYEDQMDNFDWLFLSGMDHTVGNGNSLAVDMWSPTLRGLSGRLLSFSQLPTTKEFCMSFYYQLYGPQTGALSVKVRYSDGTESLLWTTSGAQSSNWHQGLCSVPQQLTGFQLVFEALRTGFDGRVAIDDVVILDQPCAASDICSFEGTRCGFTSSVLFHWVHQNSAYGGVQPGPKFDHSLETDKGYYMIVDTSVGVLPLGHVTSLISRFRKAAPFGECVQFWYYMGGDSPGTLNVYMKPRQGARVRLFSQRQRQGDVWCYGNGNISSSAEDWQLEIEVEGAGGLKAYIAIDDITFLPHSCPQPGAVCSLEEGLCNWFNTQNTMLDLLDWERSNAAKSSYIAPPFDHTLGTGEGHFLFLPSSPRNTTGQNAWLLSPHLPPTDGTCLRFWVYKPISHDAKLNLIKLSEGEQTILLSLGEVIGLWRRYDIDITSQKEYQIVFEGIKGTDGVVALDDIKYTVGIDCANQITDTQKPKRDMAGIAVAVTFLILLLVALVGLLVWYFRKQGRLESGASQTNTPGNSESFNNVAYDTD